MKVTYPHMGYLNIPVSNMLKALGVEVIEAPKISKRTVELGSLYSPESVCLPYKLTMGNFLESIEQGADTLVSVCGSGKCRLGFYNTVQKISLKKKARLQFHTINISENLLTNLYRFLRTLAPRASRLATAKTIATAVKTLKALDTINDQKNHYGPRAANPDIIINMYTSGTQQLADCQSFADIERTQELVTHMMRATADNVTSPVKVGLVGEFYMLLEPYVNHNIEDFLIKQGVEVKKFVYSGDWVYSQTLLSSLGLYNEETAYLDQARPYLNHHVGGDGLKSVGSALWCAKNGYDGLIHLYPMGCMPEVVAQYALKNIAKDYSIPMLALSIDEHASDVGIATRIEAFVDCIKRKK